MKSRIASLIPISLSLCLTGCMGTEFQTANVDPSTGYIPTAYNPSAGVNKGNVITNEKTDLAKYQGRMLVTGGSFFEQEMVNIGTFSDVMDSEELQKRIIQAGLQDKVPSVSDLIGINKAYVNYKPFLWLHLEIKNGEDSKRYVRMLVTDPGTTKDLFEVREDLCGIPECENDQKTWYPLFNSLIDWIHASGGTVKTGPAPVKAAPGQH